MFCAVVDNFGVEEMGKNMEGFRAMIGLGLGLSFRTGEQLPGCPARVKELPPRSEEETLHGKLVLFSVAKSES